MSGSVSSSGEAKPRPEDPGLADRHGSSGRALRACPRMTASGILVATAALMAMTGASAQEAPPSVADILLGTHVTHLPAVEFVDPVCADGTRLESFAAFAACPIGGDGLREVQFAYDDLDEMIARARGSRNARSRLAMAGLPIVPSLLTLIVADD